MGRDSMVWELLADRVGVVSQKGAEPHNRSRLTGDERVSLVRNCVV